MLVGKGFDEDGAAAMDRQRTWTDGGGMRAEIARAGKTTHFRLETMSSDNIRDSHSYRLPKSLGQPRSRDCRSGLTLHPCP